LETRASDQNAGLAPRRWRVDSRRWLPSWPHWPCRLPPPAQPRSSSFPGASSAEGIAAGLGTTFYASHLFRGDIFRGDLQRGAAQLFIDAPDGRMALGMGGDLAHDVLFVAGGFTGQADVYNTRTRATVATYQLALPPATLVNDVAVTPAGAWFTDSLQANLLRAGQRG
jgi:hypothetical protein